MTTVINKFTLPPRKRSKVSRACDECRRKKVSCSVMVTIQGNFSTDCPTIVWLFFISILSTFAVPISKHPEPPSNLRGRVIGDYLGACMQTAYRVYRGPGKPKGYLLGHEYEKLQIELVSSDQQQTSYTSTKSQILLKVLRGRNIFFYFILIFFFSLSWDFRCSPN